MCSLGQAHGLSPRLPSASIREPDIPDRQTGRTRIDRDLTDLPPKVAFARTPTPAIWATRGRWLANIWGQAMCRTATFDAGTLSVAHGWVAGLLLAH